MAVLTSRSVLSYSQCQDALDQGLEETLHFLTMRFLISQSRPSFRRAPWVGEEGGGGGGEGSWFKADSKPPLLVLAERVLMARRVNILTSLLTRVRSQFR
jgi:hypothetical protein